MIMKLIFFQLVFQEMVYIVIFDYRNSKIDMLRGYIQEDIASEKKLTPLQSDIHIRISELTELLCINNNKFVKAMPTEKVVKEILEHLYNCYDQLDIIFINQLRDIPLYLEEKIIRETYHKLLSVNKNLFKNIKNWFQYQYLQLFKNDEYSYGDDQRGGGRNDLNNMCTFCKANVEEMNLKEARRQIIGGYEMRQQFEKQLQMQKMERQIETKAYSMNVFQYNNSVDYLTKLVREMESNVRSYHVTVQKVEENNPVQLEIGFEKIIDAFTSLMKKCGKRFQLKLVQKIESIKQAQKLSKLNTNKKLKLSISTQLNQIIKGMKSKKIIDAQDIALKKLKQDFRILNIQLISVNELCQKYKEEINSLRNGEDFKDKSLENLVQTVIPGTHATRQKNLLAKPPLQFKYREKLEETNISKDFLSLQKSIDIEKASKRKLLKNKLTPNMKIGQPRLSQLFGSQRNEDNIDFKLLREENDIQTLKEVEAEEQQMSRNTIKIYQVINTKSEIQGIMNQCSYQQPSLYNKMVSTENVQQEKRDVGTQWEQMNFLKVKVNKVKPQKNKIKFQDVTKKVYAKNPIKNTWKQAKAEKKMNKTVNINDKSERLDSVMDQIPNNTKQFSRSIKSFKNLSKTSKKIILDIDREQKRYTLPTPNKQKQTNQVITINKIQLFNQSNHQKSNFFQRQGEFKRIPINQFKFQIQEGILRKNIIYLKKQEQSGSIHENSKDNSKHKENLRYVTEGNSSSAHKKNKVIRNIIFKPEHLMLFGGVSQSFIYQNAKPKLKEDQLSQIQRSYFEELFIFMQNLKEFKSSIYQNVLLFLRKPYELIDKTEIPFKEVFNSKLRPILLKFLSLHKERCKSELLCDHLINFGKIIGFNCMQ